MHRTRAVAGLIGLAASFFAAAPAHAGTAVVTYTTVGDRPFKVPLSVGQIDVVVAGGHGAAGRPVASLGGAPGGPGARITGRLAVFAGQELTLRIGAGGAGGSAVEGVGGRGGDFAGIYSSSGNPLIAAGGGGGGGGGIDGAAGGAAGADGANGGGFSPAEGGKAGTSTAGGAGGAASTAPGSQAGQPGTAGQGGRGGDLPGSVTSGAGGGGGAGVYGGGGGGSAFGPTNGAGGGGGGASYVSPSVFLVTQGTNPDTGTSALIQLTYEDTVAPQLQLAFPGVSPDAITGVAGTEGGDSPEVTIEILSGGTVVKTLVATAAADGAFSAPIGELPDGSYTVRGRQSDAAGNTFTSPQLLLVIDKTGPALTLDDPGLNPATLSGTTDENGTVTLTIRSGDEVVRTLTATPSGGNYSVAPGTLTDGTYTVQATQSDPVGNVTTTPPQAFTVDTTGPVIDTTGTRATYTQGEIAAPVFSCTDAGSGVAECTGPATIDTTTLGDHTFEITARDNAGNTSATTGNYTVTAPLHMRIELGPTPTFAPFIPGIADTYTATTTASVTTNSDATALTITDLAATNPGRLVNGTHALASPLRAQATSTTATTTGSGELSGTPLTVLRYSGPVTGDTITLTYAQPIGANDPLRTGSYGKRLAYTLTVLTP